MNKRYGRSHIAALLMLCSLKSVMPISAVQQLFQSWGGAEGLEVLYGVFREMYARVNSGVSAQLSALQARDGRELFLWAALGSRAAQSLAMELLDGLGEQ